MYLQLLMLLNVFLLLQLLMLLKVFLLLLLLGLGLGAACTATYLLAALWPSAENGTTAFRGTAAALAASVTAAGTFTAASGAAAVATSTTASATCTTATAASATCTTASAAATASGQNKRIYLHVSRHGAAGDRTVLRTQCDRLLKIKIIGCCRPCRRQHEA